MYEVNFTKNKRKFNYIVPYIHMHTDDTVSFTYEGEHIELNLDDIEQISIVPIK